MPDLQPNISPGRMSIHCVISLCIAALAVVCSAGCANRPAAAHPPSYKANKISSAAFEQLDVNKDNALDDNELAKAPGLKAAIVRIDLNKDGRINAEEIEARITEYQNAHVGLRNETYTFTQDGAPLADAKVVFTPEAFFGDSLKAAEGQTGNNGSTSVAISGNSIRGMTCGMYQVSVSKKDGSGKELLPSKYNTETTLGYEFPPQEYSSEKDRTFSLTSH
jgi:hypothetical protein